MGQKVNPIGYRLVMNKDWRSKWYATGRDYTDKLHEDLKIRKWLKGRLQTAAISKINIERAWNSIRITIHTSRPGLVIGRKGSEIENMTKSISKLCGGSQVKVDIVEIRKPELDAQLTAENICAQLERRISFRRAMKRSLHTAMDFGADGIRIRIAGRLGGADIARAEWHREGKVPLQTLRTPIDYGFAEAKTVYGIIGVKVWVNKKEELAHTGRPQGGRYDRKGGRGDRRQRRDNNSRNNNNRGGGNRPQGNGGGRPPQGGGGSRPQGAGAPTPAPAPAAS